MKLRFSISLVLLAALSGCATHSALDLYLQGQLAAEQGQLPSAMASLSQAINKNPHLGVAYLARARLLQQQGDFEGAQSDYEHVITEEPYNFTANFQLGVIYEHLKKFAEAVKAYQRAIDIRPGDPAANMNLAITFVQLGDPLQGLYYAQRGVQADPQSATAHANLGVLYAQAQYHDMAISEFKKSIELDSHQAEVYLNLGQEYFTLAALKQDPAAYEQAKNVLETARDLAPTTRVWERLGATYYRLNNYSKAEDAFRNALKLDGKDVASLNGLGATLMSKALLPPADVELAKNAIDFWKQSLTLDKNQPTIQNLVNQYTPHE